MDKKFKLRSHPSAFCHVVISENKDRVSLISYETNVITMEKRPSGIWYLTCSSNYSRTTIKHMGWFLSDLRVGVSYHEIRNALLAAKKRNKVKLNWFDSISVDEQKEYRKHSRLFLEEYISIWCPYPTSIEKAINEYMENGKRFTAYSKTPNYDYYFYGNSNFTPISL